ncbi:D-alanyl-D-alanine carboxypeptidase/D-alanyl-D-alanine-endopeptidase [Sphingomonas sp. S2-65]|uniref:D-alanyl-D-alanine carboxypeptidase/D-alanyl-D-alanine endopeptidase n=1 Tax=Sphingomonas sp. S2-65 TaxID=2903960 RepID=UPI001F3ED11A|nr:D-alanyl-D-alanine carboxypeptidase/D-alanyl-D-alanine-endopeptidase [Sphingomonas sp. S2-65]UYY58209.1 D-alanyl-D-alanine carboxypeptidase/D-alanyl-D-alanine-endopeptidase [Sphingomonas sp. S2-65]
MIRIAFALALLFATPAVAQSLQRKAEAALAEAPRGTRFGFVVVDEKGREIVAVNPDGRFMPASNTKIVTTAAAYWVLAGIDRPDTTGGAAVRLEGQDVVLQGNGDARLSSTPDCMTDCLSVLADAVAKRTRSVRNVIGDDTALPDQRWSPGMSWNNIPGGSGTGVSALTLDDNEVRLKVSPGPAGRQPVVEMLPYYQVENRAVTVASGPTTISYDRDLNGKLLRVSGQIAVTAPPRTLRLGLDDPAHYAAWRLKTLLEARGVRVTGQVTVRHRALTPQDDPAVRGNALPVRGQTLPVLARLTPPPLAGDVATTNKTSQNLHAELLLRRIALQTGSGSIADGQVRIDAMLSGAGLPRTAYDFSDGSGMSTYNRIAPRGMVTLLRWIAAQPWGGAWRATLPIGGVDGTLARRFKGTALEGRVFAKTGTLNGTSALSGYLVARSGRTLSFSLIANDIPQDGDVSRVMEAALLTVAEGS